ncbi:putative gustatory receptor 28b [Scaptodrosophila lebanonensis]|uniref:Gustatory receptor n=1 Tax=Drosophila lebanonensis TaxID=7225 RepID=A0A6J2UBA8_DROLE|nr:putative gustatory receptor 28b [Scaptodrosophila lebanonensis]
MWLPKCLVGLARPSDVYTCYRLTLWLVFGLGIVPYLVTTRPKSGLRGSIFGFLNILIRMLLYTFNFIYSTMDEHTLLSNFFITDVSRITDGLQKFNGMFGVLAVLLSSLLMRRHFPHLLEQFADLEREAFPSVGIGFIQSHAAWKINRLNVLLLGPTVVYVTVSFAKIFTRNEVSVSLPAASSFFSAHFLVCAGAMLFGGIMVKLCIYITALNEVLKNLANQWDSRSIKAVQKQRSLQCLDSFSMYTIVTKDPAEIIQESMEIHHLICEAAATANKYFTYQLLTIISIAFLIIVFDAYYVLETLLGKSKRESKFKTVEFVTFFSCQMILYLIAIVSIVEGSNRAIKKSEKTGGIVHSLLNKAKSPEVKEKLQQFSMQIMHLKINFTAAGLFNIDRTLYFTISGALTTYLIILLQFTSNSPGHHSNCCEAHNSTHQAANQTL